MPDRQAIALVAHDRKKDDLVEWIAGKVALFRPFKLFATGTTGARILERCPDLDLTPLKSGPLGGDQQIGAMIAEGRLDMLIFFIDPLAPLPHDVDVKALSRLSVLYDLPAAFNRATAECLVASVLFDGVRAPASAGEPAPAPATTTRAGSPEGMGTAP